MHQTKISPDLLTEKSVYAIVLMKPSDKALLGLFTEENQESKFVLYKEFSSSSPMELVNILDETKPINLQLISTSSDFTLIPRALFSDAHDDDRKWLEHLPGKFEREVVLSEMDKKDSFKLVFSESAAACEFFSQLMPNTKIRHIVSVFNENCTENRLASIWTKVICFFLDKKFFAIAYKNNDIRLANSFEFEVPADVLYYLLWIKKEIYGDGLEIPFYLNGMISEDSKIFGLLKAYLKDLNFGTGSREGKPSNELLPPFHTLGVLLNKD